MLLGIGLQLQIRRSSLAGYVIGPGTANNVDQRTQTPKQRTGPQNKVLSRPASTTLVSQNVRNAFGKDPQLLIFVHLLVYYKI